MATVSELAKTEDDLVDAIHEFLELRGIPMSTRYFVEEEVFEVIERYTEGK